MLEAKTPPHPAGQEPEPVWLAGQMFLVSPDDPAARFRFLVTDESRRLARWLRLMGFDTEIANGAAKPELSLRAHNERRIVVTRNRRIVGGTLFKVVQLASTTLDDQLKQLAQELRLPLDEERLFTRCDRCNVSLDPIERSDVKDRVPPHVHKTQQAFFTCPSCRRVYWAATHWERACQVFKRLRASVT